MFAKLYCIFIYNKVSFLYIFKKKNSTCITTHNALKENNFSHIKVTKSILVFLTLTTVILGYVSQNKQ